MKTDFRGVTGLNNKIRSSGGSDFFSEDEARFLRFQEAPHHDRGYILANNLDKKFI